MNKGYESAELYLQIAIAALTWATIRYAVEKRPLTLGEKFTALFSGVFAGRGLMYAYLHPSYAEIAALVDLDALLRASVVLAAILVPILILGSWAAWLWEKYKRNNGVGTI